MEMATGVQGISRARFSVRVLGLCFAARTGDDECPLLVLVMDAPSEAPLAFYLEECLEC